MVYFLKNILVSIGLLLSVLETTSSTWGMFHGRSGEGRQQGSTSSAGTRRFHSDAAGPSSGSSKQSEEESPFKRAKVPSETTSVDTFLSSLRTNELPTVIPLTLLGRIALFPSDPQMIEALGSKIHAFSIGEEGTPIGVILFDPEVTLAFVRNTQDYSYLNPYIYRAPVSERSSPASIGERSSMSSGMAVDPSSSTSSSAEPSPTLRPAPPFHEDSPDTPPSSMLVSLTPPPSPINKFGVLQIFTQERARLFHPPSLNLASLLDQAKQDPQPTRYLAHHLFPLMGESTDASQGPRVRTWHYLNDQSVRSALEAAFPGKPYTQILTEIFLPPELYTLSLPDPLLDRLSQAGLQLELAYLAPYLPVALQKLKSVVDRWEAILHEHENHTRGEVEYIQLQYLPLYPHNELIHNVSTENEAFKTILSRRINEIWQNPQDPLFVTIQGVKKYPNVLETLRQQGTSEGIRIVALLSEPQSRDTYLKQAVTLGNPIALIKLAHRERTAGSRLLLYTQAIRGIEGHPGTPYGWIPLAQTILPYRDEPLVKYLSGIPEQSINPEERIVSQFFGDRGNIRELKSFLEHELSTQEIPDFLAPAFNGLKPQDRLAAQAYLKAAQDGWWAAYSLLSEHLIAKRPRQHHKPVFTRESQLKLFNLLEAAPLEMQVQRVRATQNLSLIKETSPAEYLSLVFRTMSTQESEDSTLYEEALRRFQTHLKLSKELYDFQQSQIMQPPQE